MMFCKFGLAMKLLGIFCNRYSVPVPVPVYCMNVEAKLLKNGREFQVSMYVPVSSFKLNTVTRHVWCARYWPHVRTLCCRTNSNDAARRTQDWIPRRRRHGSGQSSHFYLYRQQDPDPLVWGIGPRIRIRTKMSRIHKRGTGCPIRVDAPPYTYYFLRGTGYRIVPPVANIENY